MKRLLILLFLIVISTVCHGAPMALKWIDGTIQYLGSTFKYSYVAEVAGDRAVLLVSKETCTARLEFEPSANSFFVIVGAMRYQVDHGAVYAFAKADVLLFFAPECTGKDSRAAIEAYLRAECLQNAFQAEERIRASPTVSGVLP